MPSKTRADIVSTAVFSLAYLRHVGPTSIQYRILFDVENRDNPKALLWLQAPPTPRPPTIPRRWLGENTDVSWICVLCTVIIL